MRKSVPRRLSHLVAIGFYAVATPALAVTEDELLALPLEELGNQEVLIATGTPKPLAETPATTSVITARELEAMGAQDIGEALEAVPGLHVSNGSFQYAPRYFIRGITSTYNPHTLVLVNGIPQTSLFVGDRGERLPNLYSMPVKLLDRIEIIRGPGSAVYGADAFAGVINLITKAPSETAAGQLSLSAGSFDTQRATLLHSGSLGPVRGIFSLTAFTSGGDDDAIITHDAQSNIDELAPDPPTSLAPGAAATGVRYVDIRSDLEWDDFRLRLGWMQAWDTGTGQGINDALDPHNHFEHYRGNIDFGWRSAELVEDWELEARLSYLYGAFRNDGINLFPAGTCFPMIPPDITPNCFPDGVMGRPNLAEENLRADVTALFSGRDNHRLRLGSGFLWADLFKTTDRNNYVTGDIFPEPRPGPVDVSDTPAVFQPENQRSSHYLFVQDEWSFAPAWELTAGLRYDDYSDVGSTTNPRLSLVWNTSPTLTSKLIYGEAFRPPAFLELYGTSNPVALGNPDLKPEKLESLELALGWKPHETLSWDLNLYQFHIHDFIDFVSDSGQTFTARNTARINGQGGETELRHQLGDALQLLVNYSRQRTRNRSGESLGLAPREEAHLRTCWLFAPRWQLTPQLNWIGKRERQAGDARDSLDGHVTADITLRNVMSKNLDFSLVARNLFDADVREASRGPGPNQLIPNLRNDLPQAGRNLTLELALRW